MKNVIKIATGVAVLAAMLISTLGQQASAERAAWMPIQVNINGKLLEIPVDPVIQSGTTLVPMRAIFEKLGAEIETVN
ncbi:stalk domain-containing protein [Paenibacillus sp. y28]|uniref:stalk domain-containing protein n=1 Tax=Paenibacillus sp. y28 TaxID=3129110 RepID=UPI00301A3976